MSDIEIKRGYVILPGNNIKFGIKIINNGNSVITDTVIHLDYPDKIFKHCGNEIEKLGNIRPKAPFSAVFILKPLRCVHQETIDANISYRDHMGKKYTVPMVPKYVHCVTPFLVAKPMTKTDFLKISEDGHSKEIGLNFKRINIEQLTQFFREICINKFYIINDYSIGSGKVFHLASESSGDKTYYLLTAFITKNEELSQITFKAVSDKPHGLNGFLHEIVNDIKHLASTMKLSQEICIIKKEQTINISNSVVQKTNFFGDHGGAVINIVDSVVAKTDFGSEYKSQILYEKPSKTRNNTQEIENDKALQDQTLIHEKFEQKDEDIHVSTKNEVPSDTISNNLPICVIGCGDCGSNIVQRLQDDDIDGTYLWALNTDAQHLRNIKANRKLLLGRMKTKGLSAGNLPKIGEDAANENEYDIRAVVNRANVVFTTCGLGGGTGTGAAPVVTKIAKEMGALTIVVVIMPFSVDGNVRRGNAEAGLERLQEVADTVIVVPNDEQEDMRLQLLPHTKLDLFDPPNLIIASTIKAIIKLISEPELIDSGYTDVTSILEGGGVATIYMCEFDSGAKIEKSVGQIIQYISHLDSSAISSMIISIEGGPDMSAKYATNMAEKIHTTINKNAKIAFMPRTDERLKNITRVLLIMIK